MAALVLALVHLLATTRIAQAVIAPAKDVGDSARAWYPCAGHDCCCTARGYCGDDCCCFPHKPKDAPEDGRISFRSGCSHESAAVSVSTEDQIVPSLAFVCVVPTESGSSLLLDDAGLSVDLLPASKVPI